MAAGLGFKTFTTGEVLTAADTNGYLMQGVLVFASSAARDAAITSPQEGQFAYLKDTNVTTYYTGSAWTNLDTTGMTNPMTTTGDMVYSSSGSTPARLGIGSTGQVMTVAGGIPSWATASSGAVIQVKAASLTGNVSTTSSSFTDTGLTVNITPTSASNKVKVTVSFPGVYISNSGTTSVCTADFNLFRSASLTQSNIGMEGLASSTGITVKTSLSFTYVDSPASTSALTYKCQFKITNSTILYANQASPAGVANIVVEEITP